jgi:brefeldin A-inhibited guanine nucleotide-exchange protein
MLTNYFNSVFHRETFEAPNAIDDMSGVDHGMTTRDLFIKDAFLVFRALCKLTMKTLNSERLYFLSLTLNQRLTMLHVANAILSRMLCAPSCCPYTLF